MIFELAPDEKARLKTWRKKHLDDQHGGAYPYAGAIGGCESFIITPTSLGAITTVQCDFCFRSGKPPEVYSGVLTDFSEW